MTLTRMASHAPKGTPMPRVRAFVLLSLFVVNQAACYSWQVPKVRPQEYAAQHTDSAAYVERRLDSTATFVIDGRPIYDQRNDRGNRPNDQVTMRHDQSKMRITLKDEQGKPQGNVVLTGVRFSRDSVFGHNPHTGQPIAFSMQQVRAMEVRRVNGVATGLLVAAIVVPIGLLAGAMIYACDAYGC